MDLNIVLKLLSEEFEKMVKLFSEEDWIFYKFGQGGPYRRTLTKLQLLANKHDERIYKHFGAYEETASFNKLVVLCLERVTSPKDSYKYIDTFRRQIKRMRERLDT